MISASMKVTVGLVAGMAAVAMLIGTAHAAGSFSDDDGNTHEANIEAIAAQGITKGCNPPANTLYCPDHPVTRGQMAAFLHRALKGELVPESPVQFSDVEGHVFQEDIEWLGATGVTKGCNPPINSQYCPDDLVTRGQMAAFLVRALGYTDDGGGDLFTDDDGHTFEVDIDKLGTAGVTKGCNPPLNTHYCPDDPVLRDQMASFLARALNLEPIKPRSLIAYSGSSVWITDGDGSFNTQLTETGFAPQFSPDGTMIAFLEDRCDSVEPLACIDVLPTVSLITTDGERVGSFDADAMMTARGLVPGSFGFSWTSDGMIALDAGKSVNGSDRGIWVATIDGLSLEEVVNDPDSHETAPVFSSDGEHVAYQSTSSSNHVRILNVDTMTIVHSSPLAANAYYGARKFSFSPDGDFLALVTGVGDSFAMFVYNLTTSHGGSVSFGTGTEFSDPAWSSDGTKLAFTSDADGDAEIYVHEFSNLEADGFDFLEGQLTQITSNEGIDDREPYWSPDGERIVFTSEREGGGIFVMDADGSGVRKLATGSNPHWGS